MLGKNGDFGILGGPWPLCSPLNSPMKVCLFMPQLSSTLIGLRLFIFSRAAKPWQEKLTLDDDFHWLLIQLFY